MDNTQQLDCTQALLCDQDEEEEVDETHHLLAWLEVNGNQHEIFSGKNIIGRDPDRCKILIPSKVLSKQHAVVEVRAGTHTLADLGSCNKTRLGKMVLRPHVQYALQGGEKIKFGNVMATYTIIPEKCDDSGSETGSESMLPTMEDEEERSHSPILSPRLHYSGSQDAVKTGSDAKPVTSVFSKNSKTPQAKEIPSLLQDTSLPHLTDSLLQSSNVGSSVADATHSPAKKTPSPSCTHRTDLEEYNSDASTDVEDNASAQFDQNLSEKPALTSPMAPIPETPPQSSHKIIIGDTPGCFSPNISIPETPVVSYPSPSKIDTSLCSLSITSIPETQDCLSPSTSLYDTSVHPSSIITDAPAGTQESNHARQGPEIECSVFKKPLAISTIKTSWSPNTPVRVASSPESSGVTKSSESVSTRLFSGSNSDVDLDAPTQVFLGSTSSDIDLDAPTQVFTGDTSVDLDAPTQVFTGDTNVDLDAPTQVFTGDTSIDLDAPTQVFTGDKNVDLDAATQVFTADKNIDLDAPTKVFTGDTNVDLDTPTQVFTGDTSIIDLDAPTQVFTGDKNVDLDVPTQVFTGDKNIDLDAPTQVFTGDTNVDLDVQTQVFNSGTSSNINLHAPTQEFTSETSGSVECDASKQVFTSDTPGNIDHDAPTQVFTSDPPEDINSDTPTQVFTSNAAEGTDTKPPTQAFTSDAPENIDLDAPTQVFTSDPPEDINSDTPMQVFISDATEVTDPDAPTQVFTSDAPEVTDPDAPTQVFTSDATEVTDRDAPMQVFSINGTEVTDPDAPTQVFTSDAPEGIDDMEDKLDAAVPLVASSGIPRIGSDEICKQELTANDNVKDIISLESSQLPHRHESVIDDPPSSPSLLYDAPTQPFSGTHTDVIQPSSSIMEAWGHLESTASLETSTPFIGLTSKENLEKSDAASDVSKSLFNEENETDSLHGERENGEFGSMEKGHKDSKENYHSDESTDIEECMLIESVPQTTHKGRKKVLSLKNAAKSEQRNEIISSCKKGPEQSDRLSNSEFEENAKNRSPKLFDLPSDTDDLSQKEDNILSFPTNRKTNDNEDDLVQKRKNVFSSPITRRSTRLVSHETSTPQKNGERFRRTSKAILVSSSSVPVSTAPKYIQTKISLSSSITTTTSSNHASAPIPTFLTAETRSTTQTSTTSAPASVPFPNLTISPVTRRQTRRGKTEVVTSFSTTIPVESPICTRQRDKRSTLTDNVHSTNTIVNAITTPIFTPHTMSDSTLTPISNSNVIIATTLQDKRRTRSQRVSVHSPINTRGKETVALSESSASSQPSTSAATNTSNRSANIRSRRSKQATTSSLIKVKLELEDKDVQMTPLTTIKEKEEIVTTIDERDIKTEPKDDLPQGNLHEDSERCRRTRRKPMRYSPERDISLPSTSVRSRMSLSSSESSGSIQKKSTGNIATITTENIESSKATLQQQCSQRILTSVQTRKMKGAVSVSNSVQTRKRKGAVSVSNPVIKVKKEPKDSSEEYSESPVSLNTVLIAKAQPLPKESCQSRASTSRGASQTPPRTTMKIKMEVVKPEKSDEGHTEDSQSKIVQPGAKQIRMSECKKGEATKRLSRNSFSQQKPKRIKPEASYSASSCHSSVSSRATRSNKDVELWSPSRKQRQASTKPRVLFTGYNDPADLKIVTDLGGRMVETPLDCTVLVATGVKRTCKLLSAIGMGRPIVNPNWLTMSKAAGNFVDPWQFLLKDREAEEKYGFCLEDTIKSASNFLLFEGLSIYATPSVQPPPCQMRDIVECAGGDYLPAPPRKYAPQIRIISCLEDKHLWPSFKSLGIPILGVEFILTGLLRHELLLEDFVLN
ncbi:mediator of DNA damage checkpoint protein 1-like [Portunus trituberculatus]|uniref:mediator of DNA damage checkpoint protein 1-like n=1 Tax=Portunus trituberculatus TaxID=210409 RepID=UPI001E1D0B3C|nr:mediator of DNA damage checkpoint protein 1-like [Portunus trituberculatus]